MNNGTKSGLSCSVCLTKSFLLKPMFSDPRVPTIPAALLTTAGTKCKMTTSTMVTRPIGMRRQCNGPTNVLTVVVNRSAGAAVAKMAETATTRTNCVKTTVDRQKLLSATVN